MTCFDFEYSSAAIIICSLVSLLITSFDRQTAFNISLLGWIVGGILSLSIVLFVVKDEAAVQQQLHDRLNEALTL